MTNDEIRESAKEPVEQAVDRLFHGPPPPPVPQNWLAYELAMQDPFFRNPGLTARLHRILDDMPRFPRSESIFAASNELPKRPRETAR